MAYTKQELADIYRQNYQGFGNEKLSDDEILAKIAKFPNAEEWLSQLEPPPTKIQSMKELAERAMKAVPAALEKAGQMKVEAAAGRMKEAAEAGKGIAAAARAAREVMGTVGQQIKAASAIPPYGGAGVLKGATLGYVDPAKELERSGVEIPELTKKRAEAIGEFLGAVAPISKISQAAGLGLKAAGIAARARPALTGMAQAAITGLAYGGARKPAAEETRGQNALKDAVYFMGLTGTGVVFDKVLGELIANFSREGAYQAARQQIIDVFVEKGATPAKAAEMADAGLGAAIKKANLKPGEQIPAREWRGLRTEVAKGAQVEVGPEAAPTRPPAPPAETPNLPAIKQQAAEIRAGLEGKAPPATAGPAGYKDTKGFEFQRLARDPANPLTPWRWEYKGPDGKLYTGSASSKQIALAAINKRFTIAPEKAPEPPEAPLSPTPPAKTIWNMPVEELQQKAVEEGRGTPAWKTDEEVVADMKRYPGGEYLRKWAAEDEIFRAGPRHKVPPEIIEKFKLAPVVEDIRAGEEGTQAEVTKSLLEARGGATPHLKLLAQMGYFSKKKILAYLGVRTGQNWKNREVPEELTWYVRPSGKIGPGEFAQEEFMRGLTPENDVALAIDNLAQDLEIKRALESGEDITKILRTRRDVTEYAGETYGGGTLAAKKRPPVDLPGQTSLPIQPEMPPGKIRKEVFVDQAEFEAAFTAPADEPGLFDALKEAEAGAGGVKKTIRAPGGEASTAAPPLDQPAANFQPVIGDKEFKLWRATEILILKYAKRFGEDQYIPRGAVGIFYPDTKNIFLQSANNVYVAVHEVVHFISNKTDWFKRIMRTIGTTKGGQPIYDPKTLWIRRLLTQFYCETYPGASSLQPLKKRVDEGVAMFLQKAAESPEMLKDPKWIPLERAILEPDGQYYQKDFADLVKDCRAFMDQYRALAPLKRIAARLLGAGGRESGAKSLFTWWNKIDEIFFDKWAKYAKLDELTGQKYGLAASAQAYKYWASWANGNCNPDNGLRVLLNRGLVKMGDNNLGQLFKQIGTAGNAEMMDAWLIARRVRAGYQEMEAIRQKVIGMTEGVYDIENPATGALQKWLKEKEGTLEPQDYAALVFGLKANIKEYNRISARAARDNIGKDLANTAYNEGMRDFPAGVWAAIHDDINKATVTMGEDVGMISHERAAQFRANPAYASFRHDIMEMRHESEGPETGTGTKLSFTKEWKGSELPFVGPLMGLVENFFEACRKTSITRVNNTCYRMVEENPELLGATIVKEDLLVIPDGKGGLDYPQLRDPNILMARENGKYKPLRVLDKSLIAIIRTTMLDPKAADVVETVLRRFSLTFTQGTVAWFWPFALKNLPRDIFTGYIQSSTALKPVLDQTKTFRELLREEGGPRAQAWRDYLMLTGGQQTLTRMYSAADSPEEAYRWLTGDVTRTQRALKYGETLGQAATAISQASEEFMRGQEYVNAILAGDSVPVALEKAAEVTDPFSHMGTWGGAHGRTFVKAGAFINPAFEVLAQYIKTLKDPKKRERFILGTIALITAAVGGSMAIRTASPQQKRNYRGLQPGMFAGNIYFPAWGEEARKKGRLISIAVSNNYAAPANLINMIVREYLIGDDKFDGDEYMQAATAWIPDELNFTQRDRMMFSWMPVFAAPALQVRFGQKIYPKLMPLTPGEVAELPREERYTEKTSWLAKATANNIGKALNLSPIEVDFLIEGYLGRRVRFVTWRTGTGIFTNPIFTDLYLNAMRDTEFYYKLRETISAQEKLFRSQIKDAAAAQVAPLEMDTEADTERAMEAARAAGVVAEGPSKELLALVRFKPFISKIDDEIRRYRFFSRVKNPGPATLAERDKWRDLALDDMNYLRQQYQNQPAK